MYTTPKFECFCKIIISEGDPGAHFAGGQESIPQPQSSARLFPLSRIKSSNPRWVELQCNRPDEHPTNGATHWHTTPGGFKMTWDIPSDAAWMARVPAKT